VSWEPIFYFGNHANSQEQQHPTLAIKLTTGWWRPAMFRTY
jgi:hypothetical protein